MNKQFKIKPRELMNTEKQLNFMINQGNKY